MSLFNQLLRGGVDYPSQAGYLEKSSIEQRMIQPRTFREQIQDQIAYHKSKIVDLEGVLNSLSPDVEKFLEAIQKCQ